MLPPSLLSILFMALPALSYASPQPALVSDEYMHLMPHHTLFFRQLLNLQRFTNALGGFSAPAITKNDGDDKRPFLVDGETFDQFSSAAQRSCDRQFTQCSQAANSQGNTQFKVSDCDAQKRK